MTEDSRSAEGAKEKFEQLVFGSFLIERVELAISIEYLQEVVTFPEDVFQVPLAPSYVRGLFNLRGMVIPIVCMEELLLRRPVETACEGGRRADSKVAIVQVSGVRFGLMFHATCEVIRAAADVSLFEYTDQTQDFAVCGALKLEDGRRLVQILDPPAFLKLDNLPQISDKMQVQVSNRMNAQNRKKCISFTCGGSHFAIDINKISEILIPSEISESALGPGICAGVFNLRGHTVPLVDFDRILGNPSEGKANGRALIFRMQGMQFGLLVDAVNSIETYDEDAVLAVPLFSKERLGIFSGCLSWGDKHLFLVEPEMILQASEVASITRGHSKIYSQDVDEVAEKAATRTKLETYVSFSLEGDFAMPILDIVEIIDSHREIFKSPGAAAHILGIINLRGEAIVVLDTPTIYKMAGDTYNNGKILIVESQRGKFGLLVESLNSIVKVRDEQRIQSSKFLSEGNSLIMADVKEVITYSVEGDDLKTLIVLNKDKIIDNMCLPLQE